MRSGKNGGGGITNTDWISLGDIPDKSVDCCVTSLPYGFDLNMVCNVFDTVNKLLRDYGTCWINTDAVDDRPLRFAIEMVNRGWVLRNVIICRNPQPLPVKNGFDIDFDYMFFFTKNKKYYFEQQFEPHADATIERAKYHWCKSDAKSAGYQELDGLNRDEAYPVNPMGRNKRAVWGWRDERFETPIVAGCPEFVCKKCGKPREVIYEYDNPSKPYFEEDDMSRSGAPGSIQTRQSIKSLHRQEGGVYSTAEFNGYTDCECGAGFRGGIVLDPFNTDSSVIELAEKNNRIGVGVKS